MHCFKTDETLFEGTVPFHAYGAQNETYIED